MALMMCTILGGSRRRTRRFYKKNDADLDSVQVRKVYAGYETRKIQPDFEFFNYFQDRVAIQALTKV
ncbi:hypothetical protein TcasGA2_TC004319 [Tribolium castaneum]|uniref:Uncharacterized protein n=1 Tax=Tribolium castaneum TaxID=7070 RepID=D6X129_TRICA|nr:hypothetical protein TcasGA2_TC004319 [Tribolium castaneum]